MTDPPLIASLRAAVDARPDDLPLRLHLAELLLDAGRPGEAVGQLAIALQQQPDDAAARELMTRAIAGPPAAAGGGPGAGGGAGAGGGPGAAGPAGEPPVDWSAFERELSDVI